MMDIKTELKNQKCFYLLSILIFKFDYIILN